jgi:tripartite-type tricarboxylate transporter receptor subunit TctC
MTTPVQSTVKLYEALKALSTLEFLMPHSPSRRLGLLRIATVSVAACALFTATPGVFAQNFPSKPIRWLVAAPAGSSLDVIARALQDKLSSSLGQPVVVENRPQAGGTVATHEVAKAAPDGHTWLLGFNGPVAFAPYLYSKLPYSPSKDLAPVVLLTSQPNVIAVNASVPANTMAELVALLKASPGKYNYASVGNGSSSHLTMEYLKALTGTYAVHIPFNGGPPAALATASGDTQILATVPTLILPQVRAGRMKALAVTGKERYSLTPDLPTVAQSGVKELANFEAIAWNGVLMPAGTPSAIVERANAALNAAMKDEAVQQRLKTAGLDTVGGTPEAFGKLIGMEAAKWEPIIQRSGAKLD